MDPSPPVLMIHRGVLIVQALPDVAYAKIYFATGVSSVCGVNLIVGFVGGGKTETSLMVRPLNNFWFKIPLLV